MWVNPANPSKVYVGVTGVARAYRRRGIATVLKLRTIQFAQEVGARWIETENEENNPMYQLNLKLGFRPIPAWLVYEKKLGASPDEAQAVADLRRDAGFVVG